jgi:ribosomal protein S18 acetylase RimI-like enzyme
VIAAEDVHIRRIRPEDGPTLRDLRLRSIADAPEAFGQPLEEARRRPEKDWQRSARRSSRGDDRTWLIAETGAGAVGLVQGRKRRPTTLLLFSMWVDPAARRLGVGRMLIDALEAWASGWDATETFLWVFSANAPAIDFYRDLGFEILREGRDAESGARFGALAMRRDIHSPVG